MIKRVGCILCTETVIRYSLFLTVGLVLIFFNEQNSISTEIGAIPTETVSGRLSAKNGFKWNYGYDIELKDEALFVRVSINLIPASGVTRLELDRVKPGWKAGIEDVWSRKYAIVTSSGKLYPIFIEAIMRGRRFHHEVIVRPGVGATNELNWYLNDSPELAAHEFGHMLGLFDEYKGGANHREILVFDNTSIMANTPKGKEAQIHHYHRFQSWFVEKTGFSDVSLVPDI